MATITSLDFNITSKWDGSGIRQARSDLDGLNQDLRQIADTRATAEVGVNVNRVALDEFMVDLEDVGTTRVAATVGVNVNSSELDALQFTLSDIANTRVSATVGARVDNSGVDSFRAELDAIGNMRVNATAGVEVNEGSLNEFTRRLDAFGHQRYVANVDVNVNDAALTALELRLREISANHITVHVDVDTDAASEHLRRLLTDSDGASGGLGRLSGSMGGASSASQGAGMSFQGAGAALGIFLAVLVLIGPAAALASAVVLGTLGGAFIGLGAIVLSQTGVVKTAMEGLKTSVVSEITQAAQTMKGPLLEGIAQLQAGLKLLQPAFTQAFASAGTLIKPLVSSLVNFVTEVMPGVNAALRAAGPVFAGLNTGMKALGEGASAAFSGIAKGAAGAGSALSTLLSGAGQILGMVGQAFGQMAAAGSRALGGLMSGLTSLVGGAMKGFVGAVKAMDGSLGPFLATLGRVAGQILAQMLPVIGQLVAIMMQTLIPVLKAVTPAFIVMGTAIGGALATALKTIGPLFGLLAQTFAKVMISLTPLIAPLTKIMVAGLQLLVAILIPLLPLITLLAKGMGALAPVINLAAKGITLLSQGLQVGIKWLTDYSARVNNLKTAWSVTWTAMKVVSDAIWAGMKAGWNATTTGFTTAWNTSSAALKASWNAVWNAMKVAAQAVWTALQIAWTATMNAMRTLMTTSMTAMQAAWTAAWNAMKVAGEAVWTAMGVAWHATVTTLTNYMTDSTNAMKNIWSAAWNAIKVAGEAIWTALTVAWKAAVTTLTNYTTDSMNAIKNIWSTVWNAIKAAATALWNALEVAYKATVTTLTNYTTSATNTIKSIWAAAWSAIRTAFNAFSSGMQTAVKALMTAVTNGFSAGAKAIGAAWKSIQKLVRDPIQAVVTVVYNNGIVKLWNAVAGVFGAPKLGNFTLPGFATGGPVNGPGTGTSDSIPARLSAGEHVWTAAEVQGAGGHDAVMGLRSAATGGRSVASSGNGNGGFALGGIIPDPSDILGDVGGFFSKAFKVVGGVASAAFDVATGFSGDILGHLKDLALGGVSAVVNPLIQKAANVAKDTVKAVIPGAPGIETLIVGGKNGVVSSGGANPQDSAAAGSNAQGGVGNNGGGMIQMMADAVKNWIQSHDIPVGGGNTAEAQAWADKQVGKPYSLGAFGSAFDCSSYMSGIASVILGKSPGPMFTTFAFTGAKAGPATFEKDLNAPFQVGVENRGIGHMAGTLNGKNYEATPPAVRSGPSARGAHDPMFQYVYGMKASVGGGQGVIPTGEHKAIIDAALQAAGVPPPGTLAQWEAGMNTLITRESAWNSSAINRSDSNAAAGHPSQGLAQTIPSTFQAYHVAGTSNNILDPVANVAAAIRYIVARYGNITNVQQANSSKPPQGYAKGTNSAASGLAMVGEQGPELVNFGGGEQVIPNGKTNSLLGSNSGGSAMASSFASSGAAIQSGWAGTLGSVAATTSSSMGAVVNAASTALDAVKKDFTEAGNAITATWNTDLIANKATATTSWDGTSTNAKTFTDTLKKTFVDAGTELNTDWTKSVDATGVATTKYWTDTEQKFTEGTTWLKSTFFPPVNDFLTKTIPDAFGTGAQDVGAGWVALKTIVRDPVAAIVDTVYNNGIRGVWNVIAGAFGAKTLDAFTLPAFATGGAVHGPGTGTSDSVTARLSAGEHVWTAAEVKGAGGHGAVANMRSNSLGGGAVRGKGNGSGRYATGGAVVAPQAAGSSGTLDTSKLSGLALGSIGAVADPMLDAIGKAGADSVNAIISGSPVFENGMDGMISDAISSTEAWIKEHDISPTMGGVNDKAAQAWADSQVGKPYVLGGDFVNGIDCSEYQSGIARAILGETPAPWFTTFAFEGDTAPTGFVQGLKAPYMVGITNVGVGHMAGTLNGKNYEATPPAVRSGPSARGYDDPMFTNIYGFKPSVESAIGTVTDANHLAIIDAAMAAAGVPPPDTQAAWENGMNTIIIRESNWDPNAINLYDSNAAAGYPSQGLAQVIPPTFAAYHVAGTSSNILDPIANVAAAINYIVHTYGSIGNVQQANPNLPPLGYARGTKSAHSGWALVGENGPEPVNFGGGGQQVRSFKDSLHDMHESGHDHGGSDSSTITVGDVNITVQGNCDEKTVEQMKAPDFVNQLRGAIIAGVGKRN